ncbi:unnamed protein product [Linum trigynum]|uniref:Uncharacterized protein n=1 Tax=Linum trigynum TaxID=586398 RepID=A0AAV2CY48_9ROSI
MSSMKASSLASGGGSGESSKLAARPVSAGAVAAEPPAYDEPKHDPSRCEQGSPPAGPSCGQVTHHMQPSWCYTRSGEPSTAAGTGADAQGATDFGDSAAGTGE